MHVIIWEFVVDPDRAEDFEAAYGPAGPWARLFSQAEGFMGLELLHDPARPGRYLTLDRWRSAQDAAAFQATFGEVYRALDIELEGRADAETALGAFETKG
jgi:heme-degrading monooxygenase HmoA